MERSETRILSSRLDEPELERSGGGVKESVVCVLAVLVLVAVGLTMAFYYTFWPMENEGTAPPSSDRGNIKDRENAIVRMLKASMVPEENPCRDFYNFVCGNYKSPSVDTLSQMHDHMYESLFRTLKDAAIPERGQNAAQKAAALYKVCVDPSIDEKSDFGLFLNCVGLSPAAYQKVDALDKILSLFFRLNLITLLGLSLEDTKLYKRKRELRITMSEPFLLWLKYRRVPGIAMPYEETLGLPNEAIIEAENTAAGLLSQDVRQGVTYVKFTTVGRLVELTPNITGDRWTTLINTHSNGLYDADAEIQVSEPGLRYFNRLYADLGNETLGLLTAWELVRTLTPLSVTVVARKYDKRSLETQCFEAVRKAMEVPLLSWLLFTEVPPAAVDVATSMVTHIRDSVIEEIHDSAWISRTTLVAALRKIHAMGLHVGYPRYLRSTSAINTAYSRYPEVSGTFLAPWLDAMKLTAAWVLTNHSSFRFSVASTNAVYMYLRNMIKIPAAILRSPVFDPSAPKAFNYGSLGTIVGHEITHAFDREGGKWDSRGRSVHWWSRRSRNAYEARVGCLRRSHNTTDTSQDSENTADLAGLVSSHCAFMDLEDKDRQEEFPEFPYGGDQLFFIASCLRLCSSVSSITYRGYASFRSRCNVPLRNLEAFGEAFNCPVGSYMRPQPAERCSLW